MIAIGLGHRLSQENSGRRRAFRMRVDAAAAGGERRQGGGNPADRGDADCRDDGRRPASIRCPGSRRSAGESTCGCTSMRLTPASPRCCRRIDGFWKARNDADSVVVNPHKWLFTPFDLSAFYCRRMDVVRRAFSLSPDYLRTRDAGEIHNLMDTGVQLGRRFRALKLWMVLRAYGAQGIREILGNHIALAGKFAAVGGSPIRISNASLRSPSA